MGLFKFVRNFTVGKPDPSTIALQWYWFEWFHFQRHFFDAGAFTLPMTDEDFGFNIVDRSGLTARAPTNPLTPSASP